MNTLVSALLVMTLQATAAAELRPLFEALRTVETGGHPNPANARGDGGRSLGPYQISRPYWQDSGVRGRYHMVRSRAYAERVMIAYWKKYCPHALRRGDFQTLARIHNGGPRGRQTSRTAAYWRRVQRTLPE